VEGGPVGLSMVERRAVTREVARRYRSSSKTVKGAMLDELCALTGWHRDYARRALRTAAARPQAKGRAPVAVRRARPPVQQLCRRPRLRFPPVPFDGLAVGGDHRRGRPVSLDDELVDAGGVERVEVLKGEGLKNEQVEADRLADLDVVAVVETRGPYALSRMSVRSKTTM
jgi:hypothetical protein